jgi:hypothetical protein
VPGCAGRGAAARLRQPEGHLQVGLLIIYSCTNDGGLCNVTPWGVAARL